MDVTVCRDHPGSGGKAPTLDVDMLVSRSVVSASMEGTLSPDARLSWW